MDRNPGESPHLVQEVRVVGPRALREPRRRVRRRVRLDRHLRVGRLEHLGVHDLSALLAGPCGQDFGHFVLEFVCPQGGDSPCTQKLYDLLKSFLSDPFKMERGDGGRRAGRQPSTTGEAVLLSLWALACVLMLFVGVSDGRAPRFASSPGSNGAIGEKIQHGAVFSPSVEFVAPVEGVEEQEAAVMLVEGSMEPIGDLEEQEATMTLVETLPIGDLNLSSTAPTTFDALLRRVQTATETIDLSAMYW